MLCYKEFFSCLLINWKKTCIPIAIVVLLANILTLIGLLIDINSSLHVLLSLGNFFLLFLSAGMMSKIAIQSYLGRPLIWSEIFKGALKKWLSLFGTFILFGLLCFVCIGVGAGVFYMGTLLVKGLGPNVGLIVIISLMLFILAFIGFNVWVLMGFSLSITAMFSDNLGAVDCMDRSWKLTKGHRFQILLRYLLFMGPYTVLATGELIIYKLAFDVMLPLGILSVIGASLWPILTTILYFDLKKREEHFVPVETSI